ncbi:MAG: hypothetical protein ABR884_02445 [Minisyncoccia bacterium]|jgi:hypothetical protein
MRIKKDGTVFRIELGSVTREFETRISHAVNAQGELTRPRLEIGRQELESFFVEALPHVRGHYFMITGHGESLEEKHKIVTGLIQLAKDIAVYCTAEQERRLLIPREVQVEIEMLSALQINTPIERVDQLTLRAAISALTQQLLKSGPKRITKLHLAHYARDDQRGFSGWRLSSSDDVRFQLPSSAVMTGVLHRTFAENDSEVQVVSAPEAFSTSHIIRLPGKLRPNQREHFLGGLVKMIFATEA